MKRGLWLALLGWPALAAAWEEETRHRLHLGLQPGRGGATPRPPTNRPAPCAG